MNENKNVCLSIKALYEAHNDGVLTYTDVLYETDRYIDGEVTEYYDLRSKDGDLVCMDGEEVTITDETEATITFLNENGEQPATFTLTREEYETALFKEPDFTRDELLMLSDGVLRLIQDASTSRGLVHDHKIQTDIQEHIKKLQELNTKICDYMK